MTSPKRKLACIFVVIAISLTAYLVRRYYLPTPVAPVKDNTSETAPDPETIIRGLVQSALDANTLLYGASDANELRKRIDAIFTTPLSDEVYARCLPQLQSATSWPVAEIEKLTTTPDKENFIVSANLRIDDNWEGEAPKYRSTKSVFKVKKTPQGLRIYYQKHFD